MLITNRTIHCILFLQLVVSCLSWIDKVDASSKYDCCKSPLIKNEEDGFFKCRNERKIDTFVYKFKCINQTMLSEEQMNSPYLQNIAICKECISFFLN
ncbi:hypothetical protein PPL_05681 [Heterostelium album PN500]|uniref:Uncharacterized protein n=1 Tax=Heterostelium pallidum (strain ATCC 26659 / Pp 5 / PN500) TaxID=670386 RepID=D3BAV0_HETP5|nr:hypothetical protein PPL_05681 [Heterostelium album PN500]EFA81687.1 hypothetical protein PPL_05681 [Heterostelium album PN500]|eukprot:XP_020433804.1 hypothetical protein PPL_05681 [Heterostelium album PN500]